MCRDESGASLVEFALVVPIFCLLLFAMIDFGFAFQSFIGLRNGVNTAARMASVNETDPSCSMQQNPPVNPMICTVQHRIGTLLGVDPNSVQVAISFPTCNAVTGGNVQNASCGSGSTVEVSAQATLKSATGFTAPFLTGKHICASSQIRIEQDAGSWAGSTGTTPSCAT